MFISEVGSQIVAKVKREFCGKCVPLALVDCLRALVNATGGHFTQAKSRDHGIVRAQKKVSKGRPNAPPKPCSVVTSLQV